MSRSQRSQRRREAAESQPARRGTELEFRCRDHPTLRVVSVWVMDDDDRLETRPVAALRPDPDTGAALLFDACPRCLRPVMWTEAALRTKVDQTRRAGKRQAPVRF